MDIIYFLAIIVIIFLLFLKYHTNLNLLKKENCELKKQLEIQKCNSFNAASTNHINEQKETDIRKIKILDFLLKHETITNNQAESLLKISNSTAYRLLEELEGEGKILQIGNTGKDVYYIFNRYKNN